MAASDSDGDAASYLPIARARRHALQLPAELGPPALPTLDLDLYLAPAPAGSLDDDRAQIVLYVLDPAPCLFGMAALFVYSQAGYFGSDEGCAEGQFSRTHVVGVGHAGSSFELSADGWNNTALRDMRRRDFPPRTHPAHGPERVPNAHAARLAAALSDVVAPKAEALLGLPPGQSGRPVRRCVLGASYSAVLALQALMLRPQGFTDLILGSPSIPFDPELLDDLRSLDAPRLDAVGACIIVGARERLGSALAANVGTKAMPTIPELAPSLATALRDRGAEVDGPHEIDGEDHCSAKLPLVSRGLTWLVQRSHDSDKAASAAAVPSA